MSRTKEDRDAQRARGALIPNGSCHFCGYKVPPKAHWCSGECAQDHAAETRHQGGAEGQPGHSGL